MFESGNNVHYKRRRHRLCQIASPQVAPSKTKKKRKASARNGCYEDIVTPPGVGFHRGSSKWRVRVKVGENRVQIGEFHRKEDAVCEYNKFTSQSRAPFIVPRVYKMFPICYPAIPAGDPIRNRPPTHWVHMASTQNPLISIPPNTVPWVPLPVPQGADVIVRQNVPSFEQMCLDNTRLASSLGLESLLRIGSLFGTARSEGRAVDICRDISSDILDAWCDRERLAADRFNGYNSYLQTRHAHSAVSQMTHTRVVPARHWRSFVRMFPLVTAVVDFACSQANSILGKASCSLDLLIDAHLVLQTRESQNGSVFSAHQDDHHIEHGKVHGFTIIVSLSQYGTPTQMRVLGDLDHFSGGMAAEYNELDFVVFPSLAWHESLEVAGNGDFRVLKLALFFEKLTPRGERMARERGHQKVPDRSSSDVKAAGGACRSPEPTSAGCLAS